MDENKNYRQRIVDYLKILSSAEGQIEYQKSCANINVPDELLCMWFDDLAMPESLKSASGILSTVEIKAIARFSENLNKIGDLIRKPNEISIEYLLKNREWMKIIAEANGLLLDLEKN